MRNDATLAIVAMAGIGAYLYSQRTIAAKPGDVEVLIPGVHYQPNTPKNPSTSVIKRDGGKTIQDPRPQTGTGDHHRRSGTTPQRGTGDQHGRDRTQPNKQHIDTQKVPRGVRNNNPGNLVRTGIKWKGKITHPTDPTYEQFITPQMGIRAMALDLLNDYNNKGKFTITSLISEWSQTNQQSYINFVAERLGVRANAVFNVNSKANLMNLVNAIIHFENSGYRYLRSIVDAGVSAALESYRSEDS